MKDLSLEALPITVGAVVGVGLVLPVVSRLGFAAFTQASAFFLSQICGV